MFIYSRFEEMRSSKGVTKKFIADKLGRLPTICQDWKYGKSSPNPEQLKIIADVLGTTVEYLTGESDEKQKPAENSEPMSEIDARFYELIKSLSYEKKKAAIEFLEKMKK